MDASGWEGAEGVDRADRASGAGPGGSRAQIGRALPVIAAGPGQGPEGLPWGSAFEALGIASSGITVPGRSESPGT